MTVYTTLAQVRSQLAGDVAVTSGVWDQTIIDAIAESASIIDGEVRNVRSQAEGWSFLPEQAYGVQLVSTSPAGTATAGTFTLTFGASTTIAIAYNASAATVQSALNTILGVGNSVVTGAPGGPWTVTLAGTLSGTQALLIATSALTPTTTHAVVEGLVTGSVASERRLYSGSGTALLLIDDCVSVSSVQILDTAGAVAQTLVATTDYVLSPLTGTPIIGLTLRHGWWASDELVAVTLTRGYMTSVNADVTIANKQEAIRVLRAAQAGEDDRLGVTQYGTVVTSKALLQSTLRMAGRYRLGAGILRRAG